MPTGTAEGPLLAGRYRVLGRLGSGGMAAVYLAHDQRLDRRVAIKRMQTTGRDEVDARRFGREAKIGAGLSHPNLVSIFDTEQDEESVLLVMEYVDGETLADLLARGPLDPQRAVTIVRAVAEGLDHAHHNGVVHRDVKPANVLLGKDGTVKLADLGIAKAIERTDITRTGTVLGTPAYMAPEQLEGGKLGPAVDTYALATMAYEMLTGRRARRGRTAVEIAHQVVNSPTPDVRDLRPELPAAAAEAIKAGMAREPAERPAGGVAFAERLERALEGAPGPNTAAPAPTRRLPRQGARRVAPAPPPPGTARPAPARTATARPSPPPAGTRARMPVVVGLLGLAIAAVVIALSSGGEETPERAADRGAERQGNDRQNDERTNAGGDEGGQQTEQPAPAPASSGGETASGEIPQPQGEGGAAEAEQLHLDGHAALEAGDYDRAIELNTRAIQAFPPGTTWQTDMNYAYALYSLGRALRLAGRPEEAIPVLEARLEVPNQTETVRRELEQARAEASGGSGAADGADDDDERDD